MKPIYLRLPALLFFCQGLLQIGMPAFGTQQNHQIPIPPEFEQLLSRAKAESNSMLAVEYAEHALAMADSLNDDLARARAYQISGTAWRSAGDYLEAAERLQKALDLFEASELQHEFYQVKREMGETYRAGGAFSAFNDEEVQQKSHEVKREIGETYRAAGVFEQAMRLFYEAKTHFSATGESLELAKTLNRMTATSFEMTFSQPAFKAFLESIEPSFNAFTEAIATQPELYRQLERTKATLDSATTLALQLNDHELIISNKIIQASIYGLEYNTSLALQKYDEIIQYMEETGHTNDLPLAIINKARFSGVGWLNHYQEAIELAQKALEMASEMNTTIYITMAHQLLHDNHVVLGNYENAYFHFVNQAEFLFQQQGTLLMLKANAQEYEYQLRQGEVEIAHGRKLFRLSVIMGGGIVLGFSVFLVLLGMKNREKKRLLNELNKKNLVIEQQNTELSRANTFKDRLFSIIAHDLRNPFQSILGFSELLNENILRYDKKQIQKFTTQIHMAAEQTLHLLTNLLEWARLQRNQAHHHPEQVIIIRVSEDILGFCHGLADAKNIHIDNRLPSDLMVYADAEMLKTILRNLIGNAIKFTNPGGKITLTAQSSPGETIVCVKDTGIGMEADQTNRLFSPAGNASTPGTSNEEGTGLGLMLCKEFVEMHGGKIWAESSPGAGSTFCFSLPSQ